MWWVPVEDQCYQLNRVCNATMTRFYLDVVASGYFGWGRDRRQTIDSFMFVYDQLPSLHDASLEVEVNHHDGRPDSINPV